MGKLLVLAALCAALFSITSAGQSSFASVSGSVQDGSGAFVPGASVRAINTATGIVTTTVSNETGIYNLQSLLPGPYTISAGLPGFQTQTYTNVQLGNAERLRFNFNLSVAAVSTSVDVSISADSLLATSSSSVGEVLEADRIRSLPIVGNNVLDLVSVVAGVRVNNPDPIFGADATTFAGVSAGSLNVQRDGVTVNAGGRYPTGIQAATRINPDLVGEIRLVLAPVDAETGRGNGQVQIQTRSGTNRYTGSAVWSVRNTALDANTWANNRTQGGAPARDWRNFHQYTASMGGPIVRNKTFFFALWDGVIARTRSTVNTIVLTPCARNGIFRYYDNWNNGNALAQTQPAGALPAIAVVDAFGNPKTPETNPGVAPTPFTGQLRYASVFGPLLNTPSAGDCSDAIVDSAQPWDSNRKTQDPTGYVRKLLALMPAANAFDVAGGDGLNVAHHRWVRGLNGSNNLFSIGEEQDRKQINLKIDHHFNPNHKINAAFSYERASSDDADVTWPGTWGGTHFSRPVVVTANFTSALSSSLVNEARFGMRRTGSNPISPLDKQDTGALLRAFIPHVEGIPVLPHLGTGAVNFQNSHPSGGRGTFHNTNRDITPLWTYADTINWTHGRHAFKGGAELRFARSRGFNDGDFTSTGSIFARAIGGDTPLAPVTGIQNGDSHQPGLAGSSVSGNNARMRNLLTYLSGSLSSINQLYFIESADRLEEWEDYRSFRYKTRDFHQNEFALFFKDDWKVHRNLNLNLGLRYEYYGVPFEAKGLTAALEGGGAALFGISGRDFSGWMKPGPPGYDPALLTKLEFVGPNSPKPNRTVWPNDWNNFGPAVGFAWSFPWLGEGKTILRGGYQITYQGAARGSDLEAAIGNPPGSVFRAAFSGANGNEYVDLTDLASIVPVPPVANGVAVRPMQPIAITERTQVIQAYDPNYVSPYIQNLTLSLTRVIAPKVSVDLKYVGTVGVKLYRDQNLNIPNFLYNGLKEEFDKVRAGGESSLLDQMFEGIDIAGAGCRTSAGAVIACGAVDGVSQTAGMHMRASTIFNANLANGNYQAVAATLNVLNYSKANGMNPGLPSIPNGVNGAVLRFTGRFPENFIAANPQFSNATLKTNLGRSTYHSMQSQLTLRPVHGVSVQGAYTWSKNLGNPGPAGFTNPVDRAGDYTLQTGHRTHDFRTNGSFELPVGPNKLLFGNASGWTARALEGWQMNWIISMNSGAPLSIGALSMLYGAGVPDVVGEFPKTGRVRWGVPAANGQLNGTFFAADAFVTVEDPQCARVGASLRSLCTLDALALRNADGSAGPIVLQNPLPGRRGSLGQSTIEGPGQWKFDAALGKSFQAGEGRTVQIRLDAVNILNHPEPVGSIGFVSVGPALTINNSSFGAITGKTGSRAFQGQIRLDF